MILNSRIQRLGLVLGALIVSAVTVRGQQATPAPDQQASQGGQRPKSAGTTAPWVPGGDADAEAGPAGPTPGTPIDTEMRMRGKAAPFAGFSSPLRWGPFAIGSTEFVSIRDAFDPGGGAAVSHLSLGILRTNLVFGVDYHKLHLALQYAPQLAFLNGNVSGRASANNALDLGTAIDLSPRFTLFVKNQFTQTKKRQIFPDAVLDIYRGTGGILPGDFLENNGSYLDESFLLGFNYKLTPRWTVTELPQIRYLSLKNETLGYTATGRDIKNSLAFTYAWTARTNLGFIYTFEAGHTIRPLRSDNYFHGAALFYSEQFTPSLWIQGTVGTEVAFYPVAGPPPVFFIGALSVVKNFPKSAVGVSLSRNKQLLNYLTDRLSDRVDVTYTTPVFTRLSWKNGLGYYREIGPQPRTQGKYATTGLEYRLPAGFVPFATYMFRFQHAQTLQLATGTHNTFVFGLRWEPGVLGKK
jgi:hypothetical protein